MTSVLLYFWLAASHTVAPPSGGPPPPQPPAVAPPQAPMPAAPPAPMWPDAPPIPAPVGTPPVKRGSPLEPPPINGGAPPAPAPAPAPIPVAATDITGNEPPPRAKASKSKKPSSNAFAGRGVPTVLPSLTTAALKNELRQSLVQPGEAGGPISEKAKLEQLATEIAQAREALKLETARLETLIKQRGSCGEGDTRTPATENPVAAAAATAAKDMAREQLDSVSKTMKGMKPEQASAVISRLDRRLAAEVLRRMRPADAGAVMGFLKPELAAELATEIATRKPTVSKKGGTP
jgi:flagellar motility protein MotE (MotC chaperone)